MDTGPKTYGGDGNSKGAPLFFFFFFSLLPPTFDLHQAFLLLSQDKGDWGVGWPDRHAICVPTASQYGAVG
jgi:hypothetical protein